MPSNKRSETWNFSIFVSDTPIWMVSTDTQCMMALCLTHLPWLCLRTQFTGQTGTQERWRRETNMTALVTRSWSTPLTDLLTSMCIILTDNLLVSSRAFRHVICLQNSCVLAEADLRTGKDHRLNNTESVFAQLWWIETVWQSCGSSSHSKQSLCGEQWRLLSPVPDPSRGTGAHLWVPWPFPDCPNRRCDPMPSNVYQHPIQMC